MKHSIHILVIILLSIGMVTNVNAYYLQSIDGDLHGFVDVRGGVRTQDDANQDDISLAAARLQLDLSKDTDLMSIKVKADLLYDDVPDDFGLDIDQGKGPIDLREANILFSPLDIVDVKAGRHILTWGTGDLLFINDLFPKDWQAFFSGRDTEYLKAPSDALFVSLFPGDLTIDIAYTPAFDNDRFISGERLSYWGGAGRVGQNAIADPDKRDEVFDNDEVAIRLSKNIGSYEAALYLYDGYWKNPKGFDITTGNPYFPELAVYGFSLRGGLGVGLFNLEGGYYDSNEDGKGDDPFIPNSEARLLIGYEQEAARDFSVGIQYYLEHMMEYNEYKESLFPGSPERDEDRQVLTLRLTKMAMSQNLTISLFSYWSPTDEDGYVRPAVKYKWSDNLLLTAGGNIFFGEEDHTFFGQFEDNSNLYAGVRYSF